MNNMRLEWCEDCKAIDNGEIKDFCHKHFIPNRNSPHYGPFAFKNGPNWYIGKEIEPKPEEITVRSYESDDCKCYEDVKCNKQFPGNTKIETTCALCGKVDYVYANLNWKGRRCIVDGINKDGEAND